jgi:hypothetical protein
MIDDALADDLRRHWEDGCNDYDLETIMAPFAADIVFSSPFVSRLTGDPAKTTIKGYDALRSYMVEVLKRTPGIHYKAEATYRGSDGIILFYSCHLPDGSVKQGADSMRVNGDGQVIDWRCHYTFRPEDVPDTIKD